LLAHPGGTLVKFLSVEAVISAMKTSSGGAVFLQPAEPVFLATADGRPVFDLAVSAILST
jgi:hypothetical protein